MERWDLAGANFLLVVLPHFLFTLCFVLAFEGGSTQLPAPVAMPVDYCHASPLGWSLSPLEV